MSGVFPRAFAVFLYSHVASCALGVFLVPSLFFLCPLVVRQKKKAAQKEFTNAC